MIKGSNDYNIIYYSGKYLFTMFLICFINNYIPSILLPICLVLEDFLILKFSVISTLETTKDFKINKSEMEIPFIMITAVGLFIIGLIFSYNIIIICVLIFVHALMFKAMDANNERRIAEANKAIDEYFLNNPKPEVKKTTKKKRKKATTTKK